MGLQPLSPSRGWGLRLWAGQDYLVEQPGRDVPCEVNAFAVQIQPLSLLCFIQMCRHPRAASPSEEAYLVQLWD